MGEGQEVDSDEEPEVFNTYMEIYDGHFDYDYSTVVDIIVLL